MTLPLTDRQEQLWRYIKSCERSPTFTEMRLALGLDSKSGVHRLVTSLEERGYISRIKNRARSIVALDPPVRQFTPYQADVVNLILFGRIS